MMNKNETVATWYPEADEAVLAEIASSLNTAFGRSFFAHLEGRELVVQCGGVTAWIGTDGSLTGVASTGPSEV